VVAGYARHHRGRRGSRDSGLPIQRLEKTAEMNKYRPPIDPHLDPLRAPSARGQHPHIHRLEDENHNPQHMYEKRDDGSVNYRQLPSRPRPVGQAPPPPPPPSLLDNPLVMLGLGALAVYALARLTEKREEPRQNPAPAPPQSVVVVSPPGIPVQTATTTSPLPLLALPAPADPLAEAAKVLISSPEVEKVEVKATVEEKPKRQMSEEQRKKIARRAKQQPRYRTGEKKGQFKPRGIKR